MNVLVIDVGGTQVKLLATGQTTRRAFASGTQLTPRRLVSGVRRLTRDWPHDVVTIGYPGFIHGGRIVAEPHNLGAGWVGFDFHRAFGKPVKILNDAALQAYGSYRKGRMLFLGLGTGLGSCMIVDGLIEPMELAHLPYRKATFEDYVGLRGLERLGKKRWRREVARVVEALAAALEPDDIVIGGGNVKQLKELPPGCRAGDNANAFAGGFRLWESPRQAGGRPTRPGASRPPAKTRRLTR